MKSVLGFVFWWSSDAMIIHDAWGILGWLEQMHRAGVLSMGSCLLGKKELLGGGEDGGFLSSCDWGVGHVPASKVMLIASYDRTDMALEYRLRREL